MSDNQTRINILQYMKYHYGSGEEIPVELDEIAGSLGIDKEDASPNLRYMVEKGWLNLCSGYNGDDAYEMNTKGMEALDDLLFQENKNDKTGVNSTRHQNYFFVLKKGKELVEEINGIRKFENSDLKKAFGEDSPPKVENIMEVEADFCGFLKGVFEDGTARLERHTKLKEDFLRYRKNSTPILVDPLKLRKEHFYEYASWLERRIREIISEAEAKIELENNRGKPELPNPYISIPMQDHFYAKLIEDINKSYHYEMYAVSLILIRKLFENLVIDILRKKYKTDTTYYLSSNGRFHKFHIIMTNAKTKISEGDFNNVKKEFVESLEWITKLRDEGSKSTHSITFDIQKPYLEDIKDGVERNTKLLTRIFSLV